MYVYCVIYEKFAIISLVSWSTSSYLLEVDWFFPCASLRKALELLCENKEDGKNFFLNLLLFIYCLFFSSIAKACGVYQFNNVKHLRRFFYHLHRHHYHHHWVVNFHSRIIIIETLYFLLFSLANFCIFHFFSVVCLLCTWT